MQLKITFFISAVILLASCSETIDNSITETDSKIELRHPVLEVDPRDIVFGILPGPGGADPCYEYGSCAKKDDNIIAIEGDDENQEVKLIEKAESQNECLYRLTKLSEVSFKVDLISSPDFFEEDLRNRNVRRGVFSVGEPGLFASAMKEFGFQQTVGIKAGSYKLSEGSGRYWSGYFIVTETDFAIGEVEPNIEG